MDFRELCLAINLSFAVGLHCTHMLAGYHCKNGPTVRQAMASGSTPLEIPCSAACQDQNATSQLG